MLRMVACVLLAGIVILFTTGDMLADSSQACQYAGTVQSAGDQVAAGTRVSAVVNGDEFHAYTQRWYGPSEYSIAIVPPPGKVYPDGTAVTFRISGYPADQTGVFQAGASFRLHLTSGYVETSGRPDADTAPQQADPSNDGGSFNWGVVIGIFAAAAAMGAYVYYLALLRRAARKRLLRR